MLKEALELIQNTAVEAKQAQYLFSSKAGRTDTYCVNGEIKELDHGIPPRQHAVESVEMLLHYIKSNDLKNFSVWHNDQSVELICNHNDRQDKVMLPLMRSEAFILLLGMQENSRFSQFDFVRMLHRKLNVDAATVAVFRRLDFKIVQAAEGEIHHGKDRMGKSIAAEVRGTSDIPENIEVAVPIYETCGERDKYRIRLDIDLDAQRSEIICQPSPGEISIALETHQESLHARLFDGIGLPEDQIKVYHGKP